MKQRVIPLEIDPSSPANSSKVQSVTDQLMMHNALDNLDVFKVRELSAKFGVPVDDRGNDEILGMCHHARVRMNNVSLLKKRQSEEWLKRKGWI